MENTQENFIFNKFSVELELMLGDLKEVIRKLNKNEFLKDYGEH